MLHGKVESHQLVACYNEHTNDEMKNIIYTLYDHI